MADEVVETHDVDEEEDSKEEEKAVEGGAAGWPSVLDG